MKPSIICLLLALLCLPPLALRAQDYPQIWFVNSTCTTNYEGAYGGPDIYTSVTETFSYPPSNPLCINSVQLHEYEEVYGNGSTVDHTFDFDGEIIYYPDYFLLISPGDIRNSALGYRISKIDYNGYYLEDTAAYDRAGNNPQIRIWNFYDGEMRLIRRMYKDIYTQTRYGETFITLDNLGRRIEDISYISTDSLTWAPSIRNQYLYSDVPFPSPYQFEKYEPYAQLRILFSGAYTAPYMNDEWPITTMLKSFSNSQGEWNPPYNFNYQLSIVNGNLEVWAGQRCEFTPEGLLLESDMPEDELRPDIELTWAFSSISAGNDQLAPQANRICIYPNPVRTEARISTEKEVSGELIASTFNLKGQLLKRELIKPRGRELTWQAQNAQGQKLKNGIYLIKLESKDYKASTKVIVID